MKYFCVAVVFLFLAGCGGGGGSPSLSTSTPNPVSSSSSSSVVSSAKSISSSSSSSSSRSSVSNSSSEPINPLAVGIGTLSTSRVTGGTYLINETTGVLTFQANAPSPYEYSAEDIDPAGIVIGVKRFGANVDEIDLVSGISRTLFTAPEMLSAIAVAPDGVIVCISKNSEFKKRKIYRFNRTGTILSTVAIDEYSVHDGIDFDKNGVLYAVGSGANGPAHGTSSVWKLNPVTGEFESAPSDISNVPDTDIDIDSDNVLRVIYAGELMRFSVSSGALLGKTVLQFDYFSSSPLVRR